MSTWEFLKEEKKERDGETKREKERGERRRRD